MRYHNERTCHRCAGGHQGELGRGAGQRGGEGVVAGAGQVSQRDEVGQHRAVVLGIHVHRHEIGLVVRNLIAGAAVAVADDEANRALQRRGVVRDIRECDVAGKGLNDRWRGVVRADADSERADCRAGCGSLSAIGESAVDRAVKVFVTRLP